MGIEQNILAELAREKRTAQDTQLFTYAYRVLVPNVSYHTPSSHYPWPMGTPGKARLRFRCEKDAHFQIKAITASVIGPVAYDPALAEADQVIRLDSLGGTMFPLPGLPDPKPWHMCAVNSVSAALDTITPAAGFATPVVGHPCFFTKDAGATLPGGLSANRMYYISQVIGGSVRVSRSPNVVGEVDLTSAGSGTFYIHMVAGITAAGGTFVTTTATRYVKRGQPVFLQATAPAAAPAPLELNRVYYAIPDAAGTLAFALSPADAKAGTAIPLTDAGSGDVYIFPAAHRAERGVSVGIYDRSKVDRLLTGDGSGSLGFVPIECLFPPAYGTHVPQPFLSEYVLPKDHELILEFRNRDTAGADADEEGDIPNGEWCHVVQIAFTGVQFYE